MQCVNIFVRAIHKSDGRWVSSSSGNDTDDDAEINAAALRYAAG